MDVTHKKNHESTLYSQSKQERRSFDSYYLNKEKTHKRDQPPAYTTRLPCASSVNYETEYTFEGIHQTCLKSDSSGASQARTRAGDI